LVFFLYQGTSNIKRKRAGSMADPFGPLRVAATQKEVRLLDPPAAHQVHDEEQQENRKRDIEKDLRDADKCAADAAEADQREDKTEYEKDERPT
jgi:hypothetical protein